MEAIVPAFLLAVLSQLGERPAWLTAILADRYRRPLTVALAGGLAHAAGNGLAAAAGAAMAPIMTPNAKALLLGVALVTGGLTALWRVKPPSRLTRWRFGPLLTPMLGIFVVALGNGTHFFTLALATRGEPGFAAAGASIGAFAVAFVAAVLGEQSWQAVPFARIRFGIGLIFLVAGIVIGLGALRLL